MMENRKPLTYESLKTVLQHMEANLRFRLASHIPSIRVVEKSVPLKLDSFWCFFHMNINRTSYVFDIYQKSRRTENPDQIVKKKGITRCHNDIDQYGFRDRTGNRVALPGDLVFQRFGILEDVGNEADQGDEDMERLEHHLTEREDRLTQLKSMVPLDSPDFENPYKIFGKSEAYRSFRRNFRRVDRHLEVTEEQLKQPDVVAALKTVISELGKQIQREKDELQPFYNRRDKIPSPYDNYIQLKIACYETGQSRVERVEYTAKLHQAEKSLWNFLFGNRKSIVHVKQLSVCCDRTLRVPQGLKFKIRQLSMRGNAATVFDDLKSIIDESSYPLDVIDIGNTLLDFFGEQDFRHPNVRSAKKLVWRCYYRNWLPIYLNLQNLVVHEPNSTTELSNDFFIALIKNWLEIGRENGTCYTFVRNNEENIINLLQLITEQIDGAIQRDKCVLFSMNAFSNLEVSYALRTPKLEYEYYESPVDEDHKEWIFKLAVRPIDLNDEAN